MRLLSNYPEKNSSALQLWNWLSQALADRTLLPVGILSERSPLRRISEDQPDLILPWEIPVDEAPSYSEFERLAQTHGHTIDIAERQDGPVTVYRPICACGWTTTREQSGEVQLGWRYGKANAEKLGMEHISDIGRKLIANDSR